MTRPDETWRAEAKCIDLTLTESDELFFADRTGPNPKAKAFCFGTSDKNPCPVRGACLEYALRTDTEFGVYGGLSPLSRRRLRGGEKAA